MILQALYEYYQRKAADPESNIAPEGWEWKEIPYLIVIDEGGQFLRIEDTHEGEGRNRRARRFLVPQGEKRSTGIKPNLLWDNVEYTLGANPRSRSDIDKRHASFKRRLQSDTGAMFSNPLIQAVVKLLDSEPLKQIEADKNSTVIWKNVFEGNSFITFKVQGTNFQSVCDILRQGDQAKSLDTKEDKERCLITGETATIARLHSSIKGVRGTNTSGASIVSFNLPSFGSYGKNQNYNAPIGESTAFAYTTALNNLLGKDSSNKVLVGDTTVVFWSQKKAEVFDLEAGFVWLFKSDKDDPDKGITAVKALYQAVASGRLPLDEDNRFYVLGLAPNVARISVRFWKTGTVSDFARRIKQHFEDFKIVHGLKDHEHLSLYQILSATALEYKMDNVPPNLAADVIVSVLDGMPYPRTLLQQCVRRIRAERHVNRSRAAILKACVNRFNRFYNKNEKEVLVGLDRTNTNTGYRIGRLFAVLEKIQEESSPGINTTIRDRFYGAASATPVTVFPQLLKLKNHHLAKLHPGRKINLEKEIQEVFESFKSFPSHLTLDEQAYFAIGYYHQRQDFFTKKDTDNK